MITEIFFNIRDRLWDMALNNHPEGYIIPAWLRVVRAILYPLDTFYWHMSKTRGYQVQTNTWIINGVSYSSSGLRVLANAQGEICSINNVGGCVTMSILLTPKENNIESLISRLRTYNEWRRGADIEQPKPLEIGQDIDEAIEMLKLIAWK